MDQHVLRNERGTTLIQVLGAVIILTAIMLSYVGISQYTTASTRDTDKRDRALFVAERIVNDLRAGGVYLPTGTVEGFNYRILESSLQGDPTGIISVPADTSNPTRNQLTLSSVIVNSGNAILKTVTVSWGG